MTCLNVAEVRAAFGRSNLPEDSWGHRAGLVDDMCSEQSLSPGDLGSFTEFSEVEAYRAPGGIPGVTDTHLLAVVDVGLVMMREVGLLKKRTDCQFMMFDEIRSGSFLPQESLGGARLGAHVHPSGPWLGADIPNRLVLRRTVLGSPSRRKRSRE